MHPDELAAMTLEEHAKAFMAFIAGLLADFDRYVASEPTDPVRDGAGYRMAALWLTDTEYADFIRDLASVVLPRVALAPGKARRRRILYGIALPEPRRPQARRTKAGKASSQR
jgi:hypothetical protein